MNPWAAWMLTANILLTPEALPPERMAALEPTPLSIVSTAAVRHGVWPALLRGVWGAECSQRAACPPGDGGQARGPFQIHPDTAALVGCDWEHTDALAVAADCAARILARNHAACGDWWRALGLYNGGKCHNGRYAAKVRRWM